MAHTRCQQHEPVLLEFNFTVSVKSVRNAGCLSLTMRAAVSNALTTLMLSCNCNAGGAMNTGLAQHVQWRSKGEQESARKTQIKRMR